MKETKINIINIKSWYWVKSEKYFGFFIVVVNIFFTFNGIKELKTPFELIIADTPLLDTLTKTLLYSTALALEIYKCW